jgi:EpsI family protein
MSAPRKALWVLAALAAAAIGASRLTPRIEIGDRDLELATLIPERFGAWTAEPEAVSQVWLVPNEAGEAVAAQAASYDDVLMRTYRRADGARVMVALAYGSRQTQEVKIHRPELCYYAQGFDVAALGRRDVRFSDSRGVESRALLTRNRSRIEIVTYWVRLGDAVVHDPWTLRWAIFDAGLDGRVPDGLLVRTSSLTRSAEQAEAELDLQHEFLADLFRELPPVTQRFFAGGAEATS